MRFKLVLALSLATSQVMASDLPNPSWAPEWDMHLRSGTCWLVKIHRSYGPPRAGPYYDDFHIRIAISVAERDQETSVAREHLGRPRIYLYTKRPTSSEGHAPSRIDGAKLQNKELQLDDENDKHLHSDYRFLIMSYEDSGKVLGDFVDAKPGSKLDLQLVLSNGQIVDLAVPVGWYFDTWHKMLNVCSLPDTVH